MSEYSSLKATINANIKTNGNQEITGSVMNSVLNAMVNSLGAGYQFIGVATPNNPGSAQTTDYKCFYLATTPGTYTYLGNLVVADGEVAILKWDTSWTKEVTGIATTEHVDDLVLKAQKVQVSKISRISNKRIDSTGNMLEQQYFAIDIYSVSPGEIYNLMSLNGTPSNAWQYAIYNSESTYDSTTCIGVGEPFNEPFEKDVTIPEGGVILAVQANVSGERITTTKYQSLQTILEQVKTSLEDEIETTDGELFGEELVGVTAERETGYAINHNGKVVANEYGSIYRKSVNAGEKYHIYQPNSVGSTGQYSYAIYNSTTPSTASLLQIGAEINAPMEVDVTIPEGGVLLIWGRVINHSVIVSQYVSYSRITRLEESSANKRLYLKYDSNGVKVNQKYSASYDIQYWLKRFGVNTLMQLYAHGFVSNAEPGTSQSDPATYITSGSDWIGPYIMSALQNPTGGSDSFTGGCHGSNGDETGDPTAETLDVKVYADNRLVAEDSTLFCDDVRVVVKNRIRAGNTQGASGRYVLEEIVTYHFKNNKIYVSVVSEALEGLRITTYYGMQMNNYYQSAIFFGDTTKIGTFTPSTSFPEKCFLGIGTDANGRLCSMHMESVGLGRNAHTDTNKYCFTSGAKMYYSLINPGNPLPMDAGDKCYWAGWYEFSDIAKIDELTY